MYSGNLQGGFSTIDLIMTTSRLFSEWIVCCTHETEHGSDHLAISTQFQVDLPKVIMALRRLYKNADWKALNAHVQEGLLSIESIISMTNLNDFMSRLTKVVLEGIELSVPITKTSPYNKRW